MAQHRNDYERVIDTLGTLAGDSSRGAKQNDQEHLETLVSRVAVQQGRAPVPPRPVPAPVLEAVRVKLDEAVKVVERAITPPAAPPPARVPDLSAEATVLRQAAEALFEPPTSPRSVVMAILDGHVDAITKADLISTAVAEGRVSAELLADLAYSGVLPRDVALELAKATRG